MPIFTYNENGRRHINSLSVGFAIIALIILISIISMAVMPVYSVWQRELNGKANLKEAEWDRQIAVQEAQAYLDSAKLYAQAEVERAYGVAEANVIIGDSLRNNTGYLHYLWIMGLHDSNTEAVYVATELGLPVFKDIDNK